METTNDTQDVDLENNEDTAKGEESEQQETPDYESQLKEKDNEIAKWRRLAEKADKKKAKTESEPVEKSEKAEKSGELDYGQKAFLIANGIKGADELALVKTWMQRTGDDIDTIVGDDIFQARLTKHRETKATADAVPSTSKRAVNSTKDSVDYWLGKDFSEVPQEMRAKVLDERIKRESSALGR